MLKKMLLLIGAAFLFLDITAQDTTSRFITADIDRFWTAYDKIIATKDSAEQYNYINKLYIEKGTPGLSLIMEARRYTPKSYIDAINRYPQFWTSVRQNTYKAKGAAQEIEAGVKKLQQLYPEMRPANLYFTIGVLRTPGTVMNGTVLIGTEMAMGDEQTVTTEFPSTMSHLKNYYAGNPGKGIVFLNVHEYVHTQQKDHDYILLYRSMYEGIAEFLAVLATGEASSAPAVNYGKEHNERVREKFSKELYSRHTDSWLYNSTENEFGTRDLGYYVGYAMAERYYNKAKDKRRAIKEMIELDYANEKAVEKYVNKTGYFPQSLKKMRAAYEKGRPRVTGIEEFANGAANVATSITQITINFSAVMDKRYRNFDFGPLGEKYVLRLKRFIGFSEDGKSASFEVELKPGQHYQLTIGDGFRTTEGIPLKPYVIDFTTASN